MRTTFSLVAASSAITAAPAIAATRITAVSTVGRAEQTAEPAAAAVAAIPIARRAEIAARPRAAAAVVRRTCFGLSVSERAHHQKAKSGNEADTDQSFDVHCNDPCRLQADHHLSAICTSRFSFAPR